MKPTNHFEDLVELIAILRKECPWDRKQTPESIKDHLIEEAYEAVEAIDEQDASNLKEELGDLLLHVLFQSKMAQETDDFSIEEVIYSLQQKLIDRHPHVFGTVDVHDEQDVKENWEQLKMKEDRNSILDGIPKHLPALIQAQRLQDKAGSVGFDWKRSTTGKEQLWNKLLEEFDEFKQAYESENKQATIEEYGDLLFSVVNVGRFLDLKAEDSLRTTNKKFKKRFQYIEQQLEKQQQQTSDATLEEMEQYWQQAKKNGN